MSPQDTVDNINKKLENRVALKINLLFRDLIMDTPVGDPKFWSRPPPPDYVGGLARGNWQMSTGSPITTEIERIDPSGKETLKNAEVRSAEIGKIIYLSNNVKYIRRLEYKGHSKRQAPDGWVRLAIQRVGIGEIV